MESVNFNGYVLNRLRTDGVEWPLARGKQAVYDIPTATSKTFAHDRPYLRSFNLHSYLFYLHKNHSAYEWDMITLEFPRRPRGLKAHETHKSGEVKWMGMRRDRPGKAQQQGAEYY